MLVHLHTLLEYVFTFKMPIGQQAIQILDRSGVWVGLAVLEFDATDTPNYDQFGRNNSRL